MGRREEQLARNETLFRSVNERVRELTATFTSDSEPDPIAFVCECGRADCAATIPMTLREYEEIRANPATFAVVKGHESPEVEDVVARREAYFVVQKHAEEARIAIETDPRA